MCQRLLVSAHTALGLVVLLFSGLLIGCSGSPSGESTSERPPDSEAAYRDVTESHLPTGALGDLSMDARPADLDDDGDLDIVIANEFRPNILLINDGSGQFTDGSDRIPAAEHDSEDVGIADFDGDGDLDIVVVTEDDQTNEYYLNNGEGTFTDAGDRWPVSGTSNAVVVADLTGDDAPDILVGNNGQNFFLVNDGSGQFTDATAERLPTRDDVTQDLELGDADGDGDLDLIVGNEDDNRLLMNDGSGVFTDAPEAIPLRDAAEETREADFGDVDGDGDLDVLFANVQLFVKNADPQNRLLINDGSGQFTDETSTRLPTDTLRALDGDFVDLDDDGDLDIITANVRAPGRDIRSAPYQPLINDGNGTFEVGSLLPESATGRGLDIEAADYNGDGVLDLYLASRGTVDRLLFGPDPSSN